jgi:hypothetical protein
MICVLFVGSVSCFGAVELGEKIGSLELTTLESQSFVMDNYDKDEKVGTVIAFYRLAARLPMRCPSE